MKVQKRTWTYCRIDAPEAGCGEIKNQRKELFDYANQMGFEVVGASEDTGSSQDINCNALFEVMKAAEEGKFDVLLVNRLDRLGRDTSKTLELIQGFEQLGIKIYSSLEGEITLDYQPISISQR